MSEKTAHDQEIAARWAHGWSSADHTELATLFTPGGTYTDLAAGKTFQGQAAITAFRAESDAMIADLHIEVLNAFGDDEQVAIESLYSGHFRGAPHPFAVRGTTTLRISGGLITANTDNYSLTTVLTQSGLAADWAPHAA